VSRVSRLTLLHLPQDDVDGVLRQAKGVVFDEEEVRVGAVDRVGGVQRTGKPDPDDVHVGERLVAAVVEPVVDLELGQRGVPVEPQVRLD
jgi:hypothetical protein